MKLAITLLALGSAILLTHQLSDDGSINTDLQTAEEGQLVRTRVKRDKSIIINFGGGGGGGGGNNRNKGGNKKGGNKGGGNKGRGNKGRGNKGRGNKGGNNKNKNNNGNDVQQDNYNNGGRAGDSGAGGAGGGSNAGRAFDDDNDGDDDDEECEDEDNGGNNGGNARANDPTPQKFEIKEVLHCKNKIYDILFVVDGSRSIKRNDFKKQQKFIKSVLNQFDIGKDQTHVAYMQFSSDVSLDINFGTYYEAAKIKKAIDGVKQMREWTYLAKALREAKSGALTASKGRREGVAGIIFIITDGKATDNPVPAANDLTAAGYDIWAVGVGNKINVAELEKVASSASKAVQANSFYDLGALAEALSEGKCDTDE